AASACGTNTERTRHAKIRRDMRKLRIRTWTLRIAVPAPEDGDPLPCAGFPHARATDKHAHMPHAHLDLNLPTGDEVKTTTCYVCACRCGRGGALARCKVMHRARRRAPGQGWPGRHHAPGTVRSP